MGVAQDNYGPMRRQNHPLRPRLPRASLAHSQLPSLSFWLQLFGALVAFVLISLFTATQSDLANSISPGESPFLQSIRIHITGLLWFGLAYCVLIAGRLYLAIRFSRDESLRGMTALVGAELVAVGLLAYALLDQWNGLFAWGHTLLQASILLQVYMFLWRFTPAPPDESTHLLDARDRSHLLFLSFLFVFAAVPAALDPSLHRMQEYVRLDSHFEIALSYVFPAVLSGTTALWFGTGVLVILDGLRAVWIRLHGHERRRQWVTLALFLCISGFFAAILLASLAYGIAWELSSFQLRSALLPLFIFLCGCGGALSYVAFRRLAPHALRAGSQSSIGMIALSMGAVLVFPITWLLTRPGSGRWSWRFLLAVSLFGSLFLGSYIMYGNLFNPWFTVFSYLKGAIVKMTAVIAAGILVLIVQELRSSQRRHLLQAGRRWIAVACIVPLGFVPFASLERYPETKAAILQFNESSMVDATYARVLSDFVGLEGWVRLGQGPKPHPRPEPWPLPWTVEKMGPSFLPKHFNLVVIVVDALRGDAFYSAGYQRNLTPFLDTWAYEEAISFRRAYSQGGGTFAAFPFLVAGRSRFRLYGPDLYRENLYFKIAQAEGIDTVMVVKEFGPRAIFPPDFPVIELGGSEAHSNPRSIPADEVFG